MEILLNVLAGFSLLILIGALVWALKLNSGSTSTDPEFDERIEGLQELLDLRRKDLE